MTNKQSNAKHNRAAMEAEADANEAMRKELNDYLARTGMSQADFAHRINYAKPTVRMFMSGSYHNISRSARNFVHACREFMDLYPASTGITTRTLGELYDTANVQIIRQTFAKLLPRPVAYMLYAPPGSQKSFVLEHEVSRLNAEQIADASGYRAFYVYARNGIRPRDLIRRVAIACGSRTNNYLDVMLTGIQFDFRSNRVLLVVDEAQHLDIDCFETLRELLDQPPYFSLLFAGSHDLKRKFDEFSATLEQWNSRIIAKVRLPGLQRMEAAGIIEREVGDLLQQRTPHERKALIDQLIAGATARDAFNENCAYINVRTLTNALEQIKSAAAEVQKSAEIHEVA